MMTADLLCFKKKALQWANSFEICCCLDSNDLSDPYGNFDLLLAVGAKKTLQEPVGGAFKALEIFFEENRSWMFGLLSYDLKNEIEELKSENTDRLQFPELFFFVPEFLIAVQGNHIKVLIGESDVLKIIEETEVVTKDLLQEVEIKSRINQKSYLQKVEELKRHIKCGDIYEITFCQEFFAEKTVIDPLAVYFELNALSPTPFAGFFKIYDQYILSASPERFLRKTDRTLLSQPIKGTSKRSTDIIEDEKLKSALANNIKERSENVMIVDLVRNDLTKSALKGSVVVNELFKVYSFAQVHQMISTISCQLHPDVHFIQAIKNTFPMGSMTGAPKIKAMQLIDEYENVKRGAFSGSIGYITPDGDFDLNVIIRSILYQATQQYLSFEVGGAITCNSDANSEYAECMLKGSAIIKTLNGSLTRSI